MLKILHSGIKAFIKYSLQYLQIRSSGIDYLSEFLILCMLDLFCLCWLVIAVNGINLCGVWIVQGQGGFKSQAR